MMTTDVNGSDRYLYRYYESGEDPFLSMTELPIEQSREMLLAKQKAGKFGNPNIEGFLKKRYDRDMLLRDAFIRHGGRPARMSPIYFFLGDHKQWASAFENPAVVKIPLSEFNLETVSFTYGDSFAVLNPALHGEEEYWGQVYFADEIIQVIERNGYPTHVEYDFKRGIYPKDKHLNDHLKYIEAHVWSNDVLDQYRSLWQSKGCEL
ncbi:MAG: hypothetical protein PHV32_13860 [Eubacteriales bacterium]|nr:hypothetical protein [Eubacteriales bacterium]